MHPPSTVCRELARIHPQLRLAWAGRPSLPGELDAGSFALIQLYHERDCGDISDPVTFREYWGVTTVARGDGSCERVRIDRGPIFARDGSLKRDWPANRHAIFVATVDKDYTGVDGQPLDTRDVFTGKYILTVRHWLTSMVERSRKAATEKGRVIKRYTEDLVDTMTDDLWRDANQTSQTGVRTAWKHAKQDLGHLQGFYEGTGRVRDWDDVFQPPPAPKGSR